MRPVKQPNEPYFLNNREEKENRYSEYSLSSQSSPAERSDIASRCYIFLYFPFISNFKEGEYCDHCAFHEGLVQSLFSLIDFPQVPAEVPLSHTFKHVDRCHKTELTTAPKIASYS